MAFEFSGDQLEFGRVLRRFFADKSPVREVRRLMETELGYDRAVWAQLAAEIGLQGLIIPEDYGGSGFSQVELAIAFEEMGRVLLCAPAFSTIALGTNALVCAKDPAAMRDYLPAIASGRLVATLAIAEGPRAWRPADVTVRATPTADGVVLDGRKDYVVDGHAADLVLVAARSDDGIGLFAVEPDAPGLRRELRHSLDQTRRLASVSFARSPAREIVCEGGAEAVLDETLRLAGLALAAEQLGGAQRCLEMSTSYASERVQFGRSIGSFQAVKHACADMLVAVESARSAAYFAAFAAAGASEELPLVASVARAFCSDAYVKVAADNLQVHGGTGFTWEVDCHLYIRRAKSSAYLLGTPSAHRELVARQLGL